MFINSTRIKYIYTQKLLFFFVRTRWLCRAFYAIFFYMSNDVRWCVAWSVIFFSLFSFIHLLLVVIYTWNGSVAIFRIFELFDANFVWAPSFEIFLCFRFEYIIRINFYLFLVNRWWCVAVHCSLVTKSSCMLEILCNLVWFHWTWPCHMDSLPTLFVVQTEGYVPISTALDDCNWHILMMSIIMIKKHYF